jgi:hypothetical protein
MLLRPPPRARRPSPVPPSCVYRVPTIHEYPRDGPTTRPYRVRCAYCIVLFIICFKTTPLPCPRPAPPAPPGACRPVRVSVGVARVLAGYGTGYSRRPTSARSQVLNLKTKRTKLTSEGSSDQRTVTQPNRKPITDVLQPWVRQNLTVL